MFEPNVEEPYLADRGRLLAQSFKKFLKRELISDRLNESNHLNLAKDIFYAPFMVVSHDTATDPIFNYGNQVALRLFEMSWQEFTSLPSRRSAASLERSERSLLLKTVSEQGYIENYSGIRISKSGKRFLLQNAIVWNLIDDRDVYHGQAAICHNWNFI